MYLKILPVIILLLVVSGCASIYQTKKDLGSEDERVGIARQYYLPKGLVSISGTVDEKKEVTVAVESKLVPDGTKLYLVPHHSWWYDDNFIAETTKDGLLTSVKTKSTYKGVEMAEKIGAFAGTVAKFAVMEEGEEDCPTPTPPFTVSVDIDPYDIDDLQLKKLERYCFFMVPKKGVQLKVEKDDLEDKLKQAKERIEKENKLKQTEEQTDKTETPGIPGIVYREPINFFIEVKYKGNVGKKLHQSFWVTIPDQNKVRSAPVNRGVFVTRQHDYTFSNGMLTNSTLDYPSEIFGLITTPLALLNGIAQAITGRFDTKTQSLTNEAAALNAERQVLEARKSLEDIKK